MTDNYPDWRRLINHNDTWSIEGRDGDLLVFTKEIESVGVKPAIGVEFTLPPLKLRIVGEPEDYLGVCWKVEPI